jgi:hypothetical protein
LTMVALTGHQLRLLVSLLIREGYDHVLKRALLSAIMSACTFQAVFSSGHPRSVAQSSVYIFVDPLLSGGT